MNLHNGRNPSSRHAPDVAVGVGGGGVAAVVLDDDPAGVLGHEEVRLARRHRSPGRHGDVLVARTGGAKAVIHFFPLSLHIIGWWMFVIQSWKTTAGEEKSLTSS